MDCQNCEGSVVCKQSPVVDDGICSSGCPYLETVTHGRSCWGFCTFNEDGVELTSVGFDMYEAVCQNV